VLRWTNLSQIPAGFGPSVVTLGNFDGVHRGHQAVLRDVREQADAMGARALAVTFDPHPVLVLHPERAPEAITSLEQRLELLARTGLDGVLVMEFTHELASWTAEEFVRRVFVEAMHARAVVVGRDTRFGVGNSGDVATLRELGTTYGFEVTTVQDLGTEGGQGRWSSTRVRALLAAGEVDEAADILGRPHWVSGAVVHGAHRGRALGYPTANLCAASEGLVPADGVYAGWLVRPERPEGDPDRTMPAAVSVGTNPTFDGHTRTVEAYVLDRTDLDLYDERVCVQFVSRLRPTEKFDSIDELLEQMADDVRRCHEVLGVPLHRG
jgi:riboflavin kinase/FMN adenylyltransferase